MGGRFLLDVSVGDRNRLDFSVGIGTELVLVWGRKSLRFSTWIEIHLVFVSGYRGVLGYGVRIEIDLVSVSRSKLTFFLCGGPNYLDVRVEIEIKVVFVRGLAIDFVFVCGTNMTCF